MARVGVDVARVDFLQLEAGSADAIGKVEAILADMVPLAEAALALARGMSKLPSSVGLSHSGTISQASPPGLSARRILRSTAMSSGTCSITWLA